MTENDDHGLPISTGSASAASLYRDGVRLMLSMWPGADKRLDAAIAADPNFALAHAARARLHSILAEGRAARVAAKTAAALVALCGTERERSHVDVIMKAVMGQSSEAMASTLDHLDRWPRDVLIFSMPLGAFGLYAFSGMVDHDQARVDLLERHATHFDGDDWWFLADRGWALVENREVARGRAMLERAIELRRENAYGVHALAHAMYEGGAGDDADKLIAGWLPGYDRTGVLHGHIAWHSALVALERGDVEAALCIYDAHVHPSVSHSLAINVVSDAASLLWRIEAYGHVVPEGSWNTIADYAAPVFPLAGHAFIDTHMAMIEVMAGDRKPFHRRIATLEKLASNGPFEAAMVASTIASAMLSFVDEDYARTIALLEPVSREVQRIGGSGAQRDVIEDTLLVAYMRAGETVKARGMLDQRLHRRPSPRDARWRAQLAA